MRLRLFRGLNELPPDFVSLMAVERCDRYFQSRSWYKTLIGETLDPREELRLYGVEDSGAHALCLLIASRPTPNSIVSICERRRALKSFTNVYCVGSSLNFAPGLAEDRSIIDFLVDGVAAERPRWSEIEFRLLDRSKMTFEYLSAALRRNGYITQEYFQYGNFFGKFSGVTNDEYIASLGSSIRRTLAKQARKLERSGRAYFILVLGDNELERYIRDYEQVYRNSWKDPESNPGFVRCLIRQGADDGALRLGLIYVDGIPAATQLTLVSGGKATMYKTAYDERFGKLRVGGIVVMKLMQHLIDVEGVQEIDFGVGEEPYKRDWLPMRRERWGILGLNPLTLHGSLTTLYQVGGKAIKRVSTNLRRSATRERTMIAVADMQFGAVRHLFSKRERYPDSMIARAKRVKLFAFHRREQSNSTVLSGPHFMHSDVIGRSSPQMGPPRASAASFRLSPVRTRICRSAPDYRFGPRSPFRVSRGRQTPSPF